MLDDLEAARRAYDAAVKAVDDAAQALQDARDDVPQARQRHDPAPVRAETRVSLPTKFLTPPVGLHAAIVKAAKSGARQIDIAQVSGYRRERVRQVLRAAGIQPD